MEQVLIDILKEEESLVKSITRLNDLINKEETKLESMFGLSTDTDDRWTAYVNHCIAELDALRSKQQFYTSELNYIRKRMSQCVHKIMDNGGFKKSEGIRYATPILDESITVAEAKRILEAGQAKLRVRRGRKTRKGRAKYVKINKVQD